MMTKDLMTKIIDRFKNIEFVDKSSDDEINLEFTTSDTSILTYTFHFDNFQAQATIGSKLKNENSGKYFWYYPLEVLYDTSTEREMAIQEIIACLEKLIVFKTRVMQKNGLLRQSFACEYFEDGNWKVLYKHSAFKFSGIEFPKIGTRVKIYY